MYYIILKTLLLVTIASAKVNTPTKLLNDGNKIPALSFGTFGKGSDIDELVRPSVVEAIKSGFRQIDTAETYLNEEEVGKAVADVISQGIVTRQELFITTKLNARVGTREGVLPAIRQALERLQLDYIDLFLIHSPYNWRQVPVYDYVSIWKGMEDVKRLNLTRSIGVSNFEIKHLQNIFKNSDTVPAVNEIEVQPTFINSELVEYCQNRNIIVLAFAPFGFMVPRPFTYNPTTISFEEPVLVDIAERHGKLSSQVAIRYLIDRGTIPIPRSQNLEHIRSNVQVFDFSLTPEEVESINELNEDVRVYYLQCPSTVTAIIHYYELQ